MPLSLDPIEQQADIPLKNKPETPPELRGTYRDVFNVFNIFRVLLVALNTVIGKIQDYVNTLLEDSPHDGTIYGRKDGAWVAAGGSTVTSVKLRVHRAAAVTTTTAGWQKLVMDTTDYNTGTIWNSGTTRATPKTPGYYLAVIRVSSVSVTTLRTAGVYKNSSLLAAMGTAPSASHFAVGGTCLVYCNGTTDYIEPWLYTTTAAAITTGYQDTYFELIGPL